MLPFPLRIPPLFCHCREALLPDICPELGQLPAVLPPLRTGAATASRSRLLLPAVFASVSSPVPRNARTICPSCEARDSFSDSSGVTSTVIDRATCGLPSFCSMLCATESTRLFCSTILESFVVLVLTARRRRCHNDVHTIIWDNKPTHADDLIDSNGHRSLTGLQPSS